MKERSQFLSRIEKIENERTIHIQQKMQGAIRRLNEALKGALPETQAELYRYGPGDMYTGRRGPETTYADLLPPIVERIQAGVPTADDKRVVDALPADALSTLNITGLRFLKIKLDMHTRF